MSCKKLTSMQLTLQTINKPKINKTRKKKLTSGTSFSIDRLIPVIFLTLPTFIQILPIPIVLPKQRQIINSLHATSKGKTILSIS